MDILLLVLWAVLAGFYLFAGTLLLFGRPLASRLAAPTVSGNLLMAACFASFLTSRVLESGRGAMFFGYAGFASLFLALASEVIRRGRDNSKNTSEG